MSYKGQRVYHKAKFGYGTIISEIGSQIEVKFDSDTTIRKFSSPACFSSFLQLMDEQAAETAAAANRELEMARNAEAERQARERAFQPVTQTAQQRRATRDAAVPTYTSMDAFCESQQKALFREIKYLKETGGKRQRITDGTLVERRRSQYVYAFETESEINLPDNTQIKLWQGKQTECIPATIISCGEFSIIFTCNSYLGDSITSMEFTAESWQLLSSLSDRLSELRESQPQIACSLVFDGKRQIQRNELIRKGQKTAIQMCADQPITFIWGPPGTGKTETLASIAIDHMNRGLRVLMLSYSNVSVDGAILRLFHKEGKHEPGRIVRYGYPRSSELLNHEFLSSYNLALQKRLDLKAEKEKLEAERRKASTRSSEYKRIAERLSKIRSLVSDEEKARVGSARFVATTVSKAVVDATLYKDRFDTVIFDEASMAYVSQIVFAAGLAKSHFICMGDFSQLPPIVQSSEDSILNIDIFQHCGIVEAVEASKGHKWLCMLDVQYRMHPDIAEFASKTMYRGLLKSADDMKKKRQPLTEDEPHSGKPIAFADLSGMMSVCIKTADKSRINVLSALITMGLAIQAAKKHEVGVITPYNAQSRLLHSMARDVEKAAPEMKKITCATVHQFQGSEQDVILYDAVDCYRMRFPGLLISSMNNNYANRLYNVALTRARGKIISVANCEYFETKKLSRSLSFRKMMDETAANSLRQYGEELYADFDKEPLVSYAQEQAMQKFVADITKAKKEIRIDIPGDFHKEKAWYMALVNALIDAKSRNVSVFIRAENFKTVPEELRAFTHENKYLANPVSIIDKRISWFGAPLSKADFIVEGRKVGTLYRPIFRFVGTSCAKSLFGFLEMNRTITAGIDIGDVEQQDHYSTFSSYVSAELHCNNCGSNMVLRKSRSGKFFLACSNRQNCDHTELVSVDALTNYMYFNNNKGKHCPVDGTSLEAKIGRYGIYVQCCNGTNKHFYKLDEI